MQEPWRGVVLFDVDCTLTREHVASRIIAMRKESYEQLSVEECVESLPPNEKLVCSGVRCEHAMMDFLHYCRVNRIAIAIGSFGYHAFIDRLVSDMNLWLPALQEQWLRYGNGDPVVLTPHDFQFREGGNTLRNKNRMLLHAARVARVAPTRVLLVDDSVENVTACNAVGVHGYLVTDPYGLTRQDWRHICARLAHFPPV